jgi:hypothetical protein
VEWEKRSRVKKSWKKRTKEIINNGRKQGAEEAKKEMKSEKKKETENMKSIRWR